MSALINENELSWRITRAWAKEHIEKLRSELERNDVEWEDVLAIRADLTRLRALLALPQEIEHDRIRIDPDQL